MCVLAALFAHVAVAAVAPREERDGMELHGAEVFRAAQTLSPEHLDSVYALIMDLAAEEEADAGDIDVREVDNGEDEEWDAVDDHPWNELYEVDHVPSFDNNFGNHTRSPDCARLEQFYDAANGDAWTNTVQGSHPWVRGSDCCATDEEGLWYGVSCVSTLGMGTRVIAISIVANNMVAGSLDPLIHLDSISSIDLADNPRFSPTLPEDPAGWSHVESLFLSNNHIGGTLPRAILELPSLVRMDLRGNMLTGTIPSFHSSTLQVLDMGENELSGAHPDLTHASGLRIWRVSFNSLQGSIPRAHIRSLVHMHNFALSGNLLNGTLPVGVCDMVALQTLNLGDNLFSGTLHECIGNLKHVHTVGLSDNELSGELPRTMKAMSGLQRITLDNNRFTGPIIAELGELGELKSVYADTNFFTSIEWGIGRSDSILQFSAFGNRLAGTIPDDLCHIRTLGHLQLSNNRLNGTMPSCFQNNALLEDLDLSFNELTGPLPSSLQFSNSIQRLMLNNNRFSGQIPPELTNLVSLERLYLQHNEFVGELPHFSKAHYLEELDVYDNKLSSIATTSAVAYDMRILILGKNLFSQFLSLVRLPERYPNLFYLDLSENRFQGIIPDEFETLAATQLNTIRLRNSGLMAMQDAACTRDPVPYWCYPSFLKISSMVQNPGDPYTCYSPSTNSERPVLIDIDWNLYFRHQLCRCNHGFFGVNGACTACRKHATCPGNHTQSIMHADPGYWGPVVDVQGFTPIVCPRSVDQDVQPYRRCKITHKDVCVTAQQPDGSWVTCTEGYTGRMCASCARGFFLWGEKCLECPSRAVSVLLLLFFCLVIMAMLLYAYVVQNSATGTLKILIFFLQMVRVLSTSGVPLSASFIAIPQSTSSFSAAIPGPECLWHSFGFVQRYTLVVLVPPILATGVAGVWALGHLFPHINRRSWLHTNVRVLVFTVVVAYLNVTREVLSVLPLQYDDCDGHTYFEHQPAVNADKASSRLVRGWGFALFFVYTVGIPALLGRLIFTRRHELDKVKRMFGFVYECYHPRFYYWEAVVTLRRVVVAIVVIASPYDSPLVPFFVFLVMLFAAYAQRTFQPFLDPLDNALETLTLNVLAVNFALLGMVFFSDDLSDHFKSTVGALMLLLDIIVAVFVVLVLLHKQLRRRRWRHLIGKLLYRIAPETTAAEVAKDAPDDSTRALREHGEALLGAVPSMVSSRSRAMSSGVEVGAMPVSAHPPLNGGYLYTSMQAS